MPAHARTRRAGWPLWSWEAVTVHPARLARPGGPENGKRQRGTSPDLYTGIDLGDPGSTITAEHESTTSRSVFGTILRVATIRSGQVQLCRTALGSADDQHLSRETHHAIYGVATKSFKRFSLHFRQLLP